MVKHTQTGLSTIRKNGTPLRNLVNQLISDSLASAVEQKTLIVNEVSDSMYIDGEITSLGPVIGELLAAVISNSKKGRIHIHAERYSDMIILEIQDRNNYNGYALAYSLKSIEPMAAMVGGFITIKGQQQLETTISLSFPAYPNNHVYDC